MVAEFSLLGTRRFAPLFGIQFLGAFNDNVLKFAMLLLASFTLYARDANRAGLLATVATGVFILPYFLFSGLGGELADGIDKARLIRCVKAAEVAIMATALIGFRLTSVPLLMVALFAMGLHSTIFGPVKFAILPQHLAPDEVVGGTALVEAGTFLAIFGGQLLAGLTTPTAAGLIAFLLALVGLGASFAVPAALPATAVRIDRNPFRSTMRVVAGGLADRRRRAAIGGISWFFAVGAVLVANFPPLVAGVLGGNEALVTLFLLIFSVAIALGSLLVGRLLAGRISAWPVPWAALVIGAGMIDLWLAAGGFTARGHAATIAVFVATPGSARILIDLTAISLAGGVFIVPLYALLQTETAAGGRARVIAANNVLNAAVTVGVVAAATALLAHGGTTPSVIGAMGAATMIVALSLRGIARDPHSAA